ncbi:MAG: NAD-dependent epimerase/dehydratase family protein [Elusimicrobia bacterium]|nr:NAD-dependent epimerase/dehydratase family protein [Elusimicrobiota bacterium]
MKALVTGGGGFLGSGIVRALLAKGHQARSFSRGDYPELKKPGVELFQGDLCDARAVSEAVAGVDLVFHAGAKAGVWGPEDEFWKSNVEGTRHVLDACRRHGVRRLVFTSSPSVVGGKDLEGADESAPYPDHFLAAYPRTKAEAERMVLAANGPDLAVVALRPHLIWGPGDNHIVPRLISRAKSGALRRISGRPCKVDSTFIDNAVDAHLLAAEKLAPGAPCAGKAYFISNGEPLELWDLVGRILAASGAPPVTKSVSPGMARLAGAVLETVYGLLGIASEPRMTRFMAEELTTHHWFDLSAARRDLGYAPQVTIEEGLERLRASAARKGLDKLN